jgi:hypothetical protein
MRALLDLAQSEFKRGRGYEDAAGNAAGNESVYEWARATRAYTRAQIRALQVCQALVPPSDNQSELNPR